MNRRDDAAEPSLVASLTIELSTTISTETDPYSPQFWAEMYA
jgi:hypothetical protein